MPDTTNIGVSDTQTAQLASIATLSTAAGKSITAAFSGGVAEGKKFEDVLKSVALKLGETSLKAATKPLMQGFSALLGGLVGGLSGGAGGLGGFDFSALLASAAPSAKGNVVSSPTYFPLGGGLGVMGEAGSEAVMPLARGPDGSLGVRAAGGGRGGSVTVNISTPDADSFRRSEAQISAALARAVSRGQRAM